MVSQEHFMRMFLQAERDLLRHVLVVIPNLEDARDVLQETAVALWQSIDKYDPARPFLPWARGVAMNKARMLIRGRVRRQRLLHDGTVAMLVERRLEIDAEFVTRQEFLRECVASLPVEHRDLLRGYYFDDLGIDALAARAQRSKEAVYKAIQRIRVALQQCVERKFATEP